jgi:aspartate ammonia-lyase
MDAAALRASDSAEAAGGQLPVKTINVSPSFRMEKDLLGELRVPASALYGVHTARALGNFPPSGRRLGDEPLFAGAMVAVKRAAAVANGSLGSISQAQASAISTAAGEVIEGRHLEYLVVDLMEGSGGTSLNMNVNEVLANRALELLGHVPGDYDHLHPNEHVNRSQSTNDVVPSAILIVCYREIGQLVTALQALRDTVARKAREFAAIPRLGRTCLQDAQPMTLGQAFSAYECVIARAIQSLADRQETCLDLPLGGTAIGTGFGAPTGYKERALDALASATGIPWRGTVNLFDGLANADGYARVSAELRTIAVSLGKIANDLILLSSGPAGGLAELRLPAVQAGSSIMPGKVNPVIPMSVCQVGFAVTGNDLTVAIACQQGQLEINPYEPVIAASLLYSFRLLKLAVWQLTERCMTGICAVPEQMRRHLDRSSALATILVPRFGYAAVSDWVRSADRDGITFLELLERKNVFTRVEAEAALTASFNCPSSA